MDPLERLTREVARTLGDGPDPERRARQRRAVVRLARARGVERRWWWLAPLAVAAALLVLWIGGGAPRRAPMIARVNEQPFAAGSFLAAAQAPVTVGFSDRSRVTLRPGAALRLVESEPRQVQLNLERGHLDLSVSEDPERAWRVVAGPFTVEVTGTRFSVDWQPQTLTLAVAVAEGGVTVRGGTIAGEGHRLGAGERLEVRDGAVLAERGEVDGGRDERATDERATAERGEVDGERDERASDGGRDEHVTAERGEADRGHDERATAERGHDERATADRGHDERATAERGGAVRGRDEQAAGEADDRWRALAESGAHAQALAAAQRAGLTALLARLDAADLDRLAHSARLAGAAGPARAALEALRRRFPRDPRARTAGFLLGRVALELEGDGAAAAALFTAYLREQPDGDLAEQARGRILQIRSDAGDDAGARAAATAYLEHHPEGSRATLARKILAAP